jgi:hypothetical protein
MINSLTHTPLMCSSQRHLEESYPLQLAAKLYYASVEIIDSLRRVNMSAR